MVVSCAAASASVSNHQSLKLKNETQGRLWFGVHPSRTVVGGGDKGNVFDIYKCNLTMVLLLCNLNEECLHILSSDGFSGTE